MKNDPAIWRCVAAKWGSLIEIETEWSFDDLMHANDLLDQRDQARKDARG